MEEYLSYSKEDALAILPRFKHLEGTVYESKNLNSTVKVMYVILMPADPIKRDELSKLISSYSLGRVPYSVIEEFERDYTTDEFTIVLFGTTTVGMIDLFEVLPIHFVVDSSGQLVEGFAISQ